MSNRFLAQFIFRMNSIAAGDESLHGTQSFVHDFGDALEVSAQDFKGELLRIYFAASANSKSAQHGHRRAPSMHGVQKEQRQHETGQDQPALVPGPQDHSAEGQASGIG